MIKGRLKLLGLGLIGLIFLFIGLSSFPYGATDIFGELDTPQHRLTLAQVVVSLLGFIGAISAFTFAIFQYKRAEKWRRMQFIADEVRDLEADQVIANALLMIDWGRRDINLFLVRDPAADDFVVITRDLQWRALLPHPLKRENPEYRADIKNKFEIDRIEEGPNRDRGFSVTEARVRDTYDAFLTRFDRLETFIDADLIRDEELGPFIRYWIDALTAVDDDPKDLTWRLALLTYIQFYKYTNVQHLFRRYKKDIGVDGDVYKKVMEKVPDRKLAEQLHSAAKRPS